MRLWKTKSGVVVRIIVMRRVKDRRGRMGIKALTERAETGGSHGWLWVRNLTEIPSPGGAR